MTREYKFRAWDKKDREMLRFGGDIFTMLDGLVAEYWKKNCILMQYTNLKDSKDVEIYGSDIVRVTNEMSETIGIGKVEFLEKFGFWNVSKIEDSLGDLMQEHYVEIIGNVFENPKLLEE